MSTLEEDLISLLLSDPQLVEISKGRINWFEGTEADTGYPYITLQLISDRPVGNTVRGKHHLFSSVLQLDLYSQSELELVSLRKVLISSLIPFRKPSEGSVLRSVLLGEGSTSRAPREEDDKVRRYSVDLSVVWDSQ